MNLEELLPNSSGAYCPYCGEQASAVRGNGGTCGDFHCLYRHFCQGELPATRDNAGSPLIERLGSTARVGVLRPGQVGDLLLAVPGLRALRRALPNAEITLFAQPWASDLAERLPYVDRVIPVEGSLPGWDSRWPDKGTWSTLTPTLSQGERESSPALTSVDMPEGVSTLFQAERDTQHPEPRTQNSEPYDLVLQLHGDALSAGRFALGFTREAPRRLLRRCRDGGNL